VVIPADWKVVRLGDAVDFLDGQRRPVKASDRSNVQGSFPYYGASGIVDFVNDYIFDEDLILLGEDGENILSRNTRLAFKVTGKVWVNNHAHVLRPKTGVCLDYLAEYLEAQDYAKYNSGTAQPKLNKVACTGIPVVLPPFKEQEAIAETLSDADTAIESLDALIAKKRDVKQATMQQLLTGRTRLPGFSADWKEVRLGEICEFVKTIALSRSQLEADHGVGCIHYGDIHTKFNDRLDCSNVRLPMAESGMVVGVPRLKVGDLVIADASEDMTGVGKGIEILGIPEYGVVAGLHTAVLRPQVGHFATGFLGQLQHMPKFREQARVLASGLKVYGLSKTSISKISVEIPPLKEQEAIAEALTVMDDELEALTEQVSKLRMVKEGMMQDLLTGKVRLV
jgi:type I restriction enzyme S subunit